MRGYLIDVENNRRGVVEIKDEDHLGQFYRLIGCDCIEITVRKVRGIPLNIVLDDCGLLKDGWRASAVDGCMRPALAGNLILFGIAPDMDLASLTDDEVKTIERSVVNIVDIDEMSNYPAILVSY